VRGTSPSGAGAPGGWREAARAGRYVEAIAAAERAGLSGLLAGAPAEELLLLADAARLARRPELARDALGAIRRRDPGSPRAAMAAFRLARLEYDEGKSAEAAGWFETFATEAPKDPLAESALGRPIEAWRRAGRPDRARAAAETYLRSHPNGSYAGLAREVMGAPAKSPSPAQ
jgi:tetratricopeptide (TPR) repeat protein